VPFLAAHAIACAPVYGIGVWLFMNRVVIPLAGMRSGPLTVSSVLNGVIGHVLLVGLPPALYARSLSVTSASTRSAYSG
jgi:hypothetical protein